MSIVAFCKILGTVPRGRQGFLLLGFRKRGLRVAQALAGTSVRAEKGLGFSVSAGQVRGPGGELPCCLVGIGAGARCIGSDRFVELT